MSNSFCHPNEIVSQYSPNMLLTPSPNTQSPSNKLGGKISSIYPKIPLITKSTPRKNVRAALAAALEPSPSALEPSPSALEPSPVHPFSPYSIVRLAIKASKTHNESKKNILNAEV